MWIFASQYQGRAAANSRLTFHHSSISQLSGIPYLAHESRRIIIRKEELRYLVLFKCTVRGIVPVVREERVEVMCLSDVVENSSSVLYLFIHCIGR